MRGWQIICIIWIMINVEDAKTNAVVSQVSTDGHLNGRETVVGQNISPGDDWEYVDSGGESADGANLDEG